MNLNLIFYMGNKRVEGNWYLECGLKYFTKQYNMSDLCVQAVQYPRYKTLVITSIENKTIVKLPYIGFHDRDL